MNERTRLKKILEYTGMRRNTLAKVLGYTNSAIFYQIETGRNGISSNLAVRMTDRFPEIDQNWILTGNGEMLKLTELKNDSKTIEKIEFLENHIKGQDARIEKLEHTVQELQSLTPKKTI